MSGVSEIQFLGLTHKPTLNLEHQYFVLLSYPEGKTRALRKLFPPVGKRPFVPFLKMVRLAGGKVYVSLGRHSYARG
jgi:hypothetical protein